LGLANSRGVFGTQFGSSIYNSLQATFSHQYSSGLYFQGAYTFSKSIDNSSGSSFQDELNGNTRYGDLFSNLSNRGLSDFDRTHRLSVLVDPGLDYIPVGDAVPDHRLQRLASPGHGGPERHELRHTCPGQDSWQRIDDGEREIAHRQLRGSERLRRRWKLRQRSERGRARRRRLLHGICVGGK